jgi:RNA-directed DNA polymerase
VNVRLKHLTNKSLFAEWIGRPLKTLEDMAANQEKYYQKKVVGKKKPREAEVPTEDLKFVQRKIKILLDENPSPEYRHCGIKKRSYATNASVHSGSNSFCAIDIKSYYKSSRKEHFFRYLHYTLNVAEDVAWFIADLCTYKGFVPTGSPSSQAVAFWSHSKTFQEIFKKSESKGIKFSLYVDDMGGSSQLPKIDRTHHLDIKKILRKTDLKPKSSKVKYSRRNQQSFELTGAIANKSEKLIAPNRLKEKLFDGLGRVNGNVAHLDESDFRSLIGVLRSIRSVEKNIFPSLYGQFIKQEKEWNRRASQRANDLSKLSKFSKHGFKRV